MPARKVSQPLDSVTHMVGPPAARNHRCLDCGHSAATWFGRCPRCGSWSSAAAERAESVEIIPLASASSATRRLGTGLAEADRVLGGGLAPGAVVLLAGEPGIGKSTLVLQLAGSLASGGARCLLVSGEESVGQVALRAARLGAPLESLRVGASHSLEALLGAVEAERPDVLVVDSVQTLVDARVPGAAGSTTQVRECAAALVRHAKATGCAVLLVGHVTKDGAVAGPKALEHVVDAVLTIEGERSGSLRLLRATKNRFGSCEETGVFAMSRRGLETVADPSALLLADRPAGASGSVVFCGLEGSRPLAIEIQALVCETRAPQPRRVALGIEARRLAAILGVLTKRRYLRPEHDVFVASAGGLAVREPAGDLALCLALHSAFHEQPVGGDLVAIGEVGLAGEVRRVPAIGRRLREAARLGFARAIIPRRAEVSASDMELVAVDDLSDALHAVSLRRAA
jgi:DNA repair protein RadA/Sms